MYNDIVAVGVVFVIFIAFVIVVGAFVLDVVLAVVLIFIFVELTYKSEIE